MPLSGADVKTEARRLGFQLVGIAPAQRFVEAEAHLIEWVHLGRHGEMGWIDQARARRSCRPDELLPAARSLIAVGAPYSRAPEPDPPSLHGRVARYARGRDYHDLLKARLRQLVAFLHERTEPGAESRIFVDTGPLVDREAAVRSGLGFYGKNTCLLTAGAGSYVVLGAILTTVTLQPDRPVPRDCGSCRLCLDACPTGALVAPYQLDARRCISYLTIELRGAIPTELRPLVGSHVFGCDVCQEVCPWNHGRGPIPWPELTEGQRDLDLLELLELDDEDFRRRFKGSPLKRAKRRGLLRNAAVALANGGDPRAVPGLARALLDDPDPLVRSHAAWALHRLGGEAAEAALAQALQSETNPDVRREILDYRPKGPRNGRQPVGATLTASDSTVSAPLTRTRLSSKGVARR